MNLFYFYVSILFVFLSCQRNHAVQETKNLQEDTILFPKIRHNNETRRKTNIRPMNIELFPSNVNQWSGEDVSISDENEAFDGPDVRKFDSTSEPDVLEHGQKTEPSIDLAKIFSNHSLLSRKASHVVKPDKTLEIDEDSDRLKLDQDDDKGSNLWIYSNVICILLVVGLSIFLIYYPSNENPCKNIRSSSSSSSSSSASTSSSSAA